MTSSHFAAEIPLNAHHYPVMGYQTASPLINIVYYLLLMTLFNYWRMEISEFRTGPSASWPFILSWLND